MNVTQMYSLAYIYDSDFLKYFARSDISVDLVELKSPSATYEYIITIL